MTPGAKEGRSQVINQRACGSAPRRGAPGAAGYPRCAVVTRWRLLTLAAAVLLLALFAYAVWHVVMSAMWAPGGPMLPVRTRSPGSQPCAAG